MIDLTAYQHPEKSAPGCWKTASGPCESNPYKNTSRIDPEALKLRRKNRPAATTTVPGVLVYGFRYYDPEAGRWLGRDPIGERGGVNLYGFVENDSIAGLDYFGLLRYVLFYYDKIGQEQFKFAAETKKREIERRNSFNPNCDKVLMFGATTGGDFVDSWRDAKNQTDGKDPNLKVASAGIFSHGGIGALYFSGPRDSGVLKAEKLITLPKLNWHRAANIVCHSCNSGINNPDGLSVAELLSRTQGVTGIGQTGYAQFSESADGRWFHTLINGSSVDVYLWSFGDGGKENTLGPARSPNIFDPPPPLHPNHPLAPR